MSPEPATVLVPSESAEETGSHLMVTLAQYRRQEAVILPVTRLAGRLRRPTFNAASAQVRAQGAVFRMTSIVEAFVVEHLIRRTEAHFPQPRTSIVEDIYCGAEDKALGTWSSMKESYNKWLNIKFGDSEQIWARMKALTDARNAIAHGVGELTRRQARANLQELVARLSTVEIAVDSSGTLVLADRSVAVASVTGRDFVYWLDRKLQEHDSERC